MQLIHFVQTYWWVGAAGVVGFVVGLFGADRALRFLHAPATTRLDAIALGVVGSLIATLIGIGVSNLWIALEPAPPSNAWGLVLADGSAFGVGLEVSSTHLEGTGRYLVAFKHEIDTCSFADTAADPTDRRPVPVAIDVSPVDSRTVSVYVMDSTGNPVDRAFYIAADCSQTDPSALVTANGRPVRAVEVNSIGKVGVANTTLTSSAASHCASTTQLPMFRRASILFQCRYHLSEADPTL